jgi:hypothetical protein
MNKHLLSRRQFNGICTTAGLALSACVMDALSGVLLGADAAPRPVKLRNGAVVAPVGQGSWHLG